MFKNPMMKTNRFGISTCLCDNVSYLGHRRNVYYVLHLLDIEKVIKMTRLNKILLAIIVTITSSLSAPTDLGSQSPKAIVADVFTKEWLPITEGERSPIKIGERSKRDGGHK